ncbi:MAG: oligoribonuclease [Myxococcales bacterium]|nr:oligoribonuclease [Myxococcales bacterium]MDD9969997.1 oligoribonuclease [Myxococcales bacterium]
MSRNQSPDHLVWLDLEMTGLDAERDVILQAAVIITDAQLQPLESLVIDIWQPETALASMTPFVRNMHEGNGLIERVRASTVDLQQAQARLLAPIAGWCEYPATLCGNSVGTDKRFLERWMPAVAGYLHYRILDVSSLKLIAQRWYGPETQFDKPTDREHDALFDIENSIAELAHYRRHLLRSI